MELNASRTAARTDAAGEPILLLDQNRALWDQLQIRRGMQALGRARELGGAGGVLRPAGGDRRLPRAGRDGRRDRLAAHRRALCGAGGASRARRSSNSTARSPSAWPRARKPALAIVERLAGEPALKAYHLLPSVRGDLLHKLGRYEEARAAFEAAAALAGNQRERDLLKRRAAEAATAMSA